MSPDGEGAACASVKVAAKVVPPAELVGVTENAEMEVGFRVSVAVLVYCPSVADNASLSTADTALVVIANVVDFDPCGMVTRDG